MAKQSHISESQKGKIFSAFYWGYSLSQIPGGFLAQKYGGSSMLLLSFCVWSSFSLLYPRNARHVISYSLIRFLIGLAQGLIVPAIHTSLASIPSHERTEAVTIATSGMYLGSTFCLLLFPRVVVWVGGRRVLLILGLLGLCWVIAWKLFRSSNKASENQQIPIFKKSDVVQTQRNIQNGNSDINYGRSTDNGGGTKPQAPSLSNSLYLLQQPAVLSIVVSNFAFHYVMYVLMNWMPTYFQGFLHRDLHQIGFIRGLPYLATFLMSLYGGKLGNFMVQQRNWKVAYARKLVNSIGFAGVAFFILQIPLAKSVWFGVTIITISMGFLGFSRGGFSVNHMDIAPSMAGIIMGFSNTAGTIAGIMGVWLQGVLLQNYGGSQNKKGWYISMWICSVISLIAVVIFALFAKGKQFSQKEVVR